MENVVGYVNSPDIISQRPLPRLEPRQFLQHDLDHRVRRQGAVDVVELLAAGGAL
jgi:hypothetical protein